MNSLEKARITLREHLKANKDKVASDLKTLRNRSQGLDVYKYLDYYSESFSWNSVGIDISFDIEVNTDGIPEYGILHDEHEPTYSPPSHDHTIITSYNPEVPSGFFYKIAL